MKKKKEEEDEEDDEITSRRKKEKWINLGWGYIGTKQHREKIDFRWFSDCCEWGETHNTTQHNLFDGHVFTLFLSNFLQPLRCVLPVFLSPLTQILWKQALKTRWKKVCWKFRMYILLTIHPATTVYPPNTSVPREVFSEKTHRNQVFLGKPYIAPPHHPLFIVCTVSNTQRQLFRLIRPRKNWRFRFHLQVRRMVSVASANKTPCKTALCAIRGTQFQEITQHDTQQFGIHSTDKHTGTVVGFDTRLHGSAKLTGPANTLPSLLCQLDFAGAHDMYRLDTKTFVPIIRVEDTHGKSPKLPGHVNRLGGPGISS